MCVRSCTRIGIDKPARRFSFGGRKKYVRTRCVAYIIHKDRGARFGRNYTRPQLDRTQTRRELGSTVKTANGYDARFEQNNGNENVRTDVPGGTEFRGDGRARGNGSGRGRDSDEAETVFWRSKRRGKKNLGGITIRGYWQRGKPDGNRSQRYTRARQTRLPLRVGRHSPHPFRGLVVRAHIFNGGILLEIVTRHV